MKVDSELILALKELENEKNIRREFLLDAIKSSLILACKNHYGTVSNIKVDVDPETYECSINMEREIIDDGDDYINELTEIKYSEVEEVIKKQVREEMESELIDKKNKKIPKKLPASKEKELMAETKKRMENYHVGDIFLYPVDTKSFGHIATQNAKGVIVQRIREEERRSVYEEIIGKLDKIAIGKIGKQQQKSFIINLGRVDAILPETEQVIIEKQKAGANTYEELKTGKDITVYVQEVEDTSKGPRVKVSRSSPMLVKRLFEENVPELKSENGNPPIVEIKAIAREAGSRTKMAVTSHDPNIDPIGSCVGTNGARVNTVVDVLNECRRKDDVSKWEKIDIIEWDDDPSNLIQNALAPAKVAMVISDEEERRALVVVSDSQLSLAIGKEGQNARLAAKITDYKIDIKSETQAKEEGIFDECGIEYKNTTEV